MELIDPTQTHSHEAVTGSPFVRGRGRHWGGFGSKYLEAAGMSWPEKTAKAISAEQHETSNGGGSNIRPSLELVVDPAKTGSTIPFRSKLQRSQTALVSTFSALMLIGGLIEGQFLEPLDLGFAIELPDVSELVGLSFAGWHVALFLAIAQVIVKELPDDPALPALGKIMTKGLGEILPELGPREEATIRICNHHPGSRATLEVRALSRRFAVKIYAKDPSGEAEVYRLMTVKGLASDSGPRVPRLLNWDPDQKFLVLSWLEGPPMNKLVKNGEGRRAGELTAAWLRADSTLDARIGPPRSGAYTLSRVRLSITTLCAADPALGATAMRTAKILMETQPEEGTPYLVHGTLYARHIFDTGNGPGVIDWNKFGQGPLEIDAGMFLATISRTGLRHKADEASRATEAFLEGVRGLVDPNSLEWYWAASLLRLSARGVETELRPRPTSRAGALVAESARHAERMVSGASG